MGKDDVVHKTGSTWYINTPSEEDLATAIGNTHKNFGEDRTCSSEEAFGGQTNTNTQKQIDTLITILRSPIGGGVTIGRVLCRLAAGYTRWTSRSVSGLNSSRRCATVSSHERRSLEKTARRRRVAVVSSSRRRVRLAARYNGAVRLHNKCPRTPALGPNPNAEPWLLTLTQQVCLQLLRRLTTWHCSHLLLTSPSQIWIERRPRLLQQTRRAAIDRYLLPAEPKAANPPHAAAVVDRWDEQIDGHTDRHRTVT